MDVGLIVMVFFLSVVNTAMAMKLLDHRQKMKSLCAAMNDLVLRIQTVEAKLKSAQVYEIKPGAYHRGKQGTMVPSNREETIRDRAPIGPPKITIDERAYTGLPMEDLSLTPEGPHYAQDGAS